MVKYVRRCALVLGLLLFGQLSGKAQTFALKTDVLNWATASFNIEPEVRVGDNSTLALGLSWNPWTFKESTANRKWRHLRVQPEYRYWFCRPFGGHFLGCMLPILVLMPVMLICLSGFIQNWPTNVFKAMNGRWVLATATTGFFLRAGVLKPRWV